MSEEDCFESSRERSFSCDQVCRFFISNKCLRGSSCPYSHDLTPDCDHHEEDDPGATIGVDESCSICLQSILIEGKRFGLLPQCTHVFCLDCIATWRSSSPNHELSRKCPVCRISSFFLIPSPRFFVGELKRKRVYEYLKFLASKPCRYPIEICPYGPICFFNHQSSTGKCTIEQKAQLVFTDGCIFPTPPGASN